jgi:hypothetical protein
MPSYLSPGVYIEEVASGSSSLSAGATAIAAFVGYTEKGPKSEGDPHGETPTLVSSWADFQSKYGGPIEGAMLPHAVYGWFSNDGGLCYIARVLHEKASTEPGQLALPATAKKLKDIVEITSKGAPEGMTVNVTVNNEIDPDDPASEPTFDLTVLRDGQEPVTYEGLSVAKASPNFAATKTKESELITVTVNEVPKDVTDLTLALPKPGNYPVKAAPSEPLAPKAPQFIGSETARRGINGLALREDVTIVMVPDLVTAAALKDDEGKPNGKYDLGMYQSVQTAMITHCEQHGNRMAILDPPPGLGVSEMATWREDVGYSSAFATLYYPNIMIQNPLQKTAADPDQIMVPPCGHVAGLWARTDSTRGVWKAPANDTLRGLLGLERNITMAEQTMLNPVGINCIRPFGTRGTRVWGARTLAEAGGDWRYINVRRLFNMIETTIMEGTQWAVFEPNDMKLWEGVKRTLNAFLRGLWRDGALFGATAEQAFFVKCDAENNPRESIDEGKLIVEVGIAPVKPAEFVIFRISQYKDAAA